MSVSVQTDEHAYFAGMAFSQDWFSNHIPHLKQALAKFVDQPVRILEIGSHEGRSATFLLQYLPQSQITCVDCWGGDGSVEARFDQNTSGFAARIRKLRGFSGAMMHDLLQEGQRYDIIYIDGGHDRKTVFLDTASAWPMLKVGGVLVWDDWRWGKGMPSEDRPEDAINVFFAMFRPCIRQLHCFYQVVIEKTAEWPEVPKGLRPRKKKKMLLWRLFPNGRKAAAGA